MCGVASEKGKGEGGWEGGQWYGTHGDEVKKNEGEGEANEIGMNKYSERTIEPMLNFLVIFSK